MHRTSTIKTIGWNFVWVLIFLGSVTAVTAIRRSFHNQDRVMAVARAVSTETIRLTSLTRSLLNR